MKLRNKIRNYFRVQFRKTYHGWVGVKPPRQAVLADDWLARNPEAGSRIPLAPSVNVCYPPRLMGGALHEIEPHLETLTSQQRAEFESEIYQPLRLTLPQTSVLHLKDGRVACRGPAVITGDDCLLSNLGFAKFVDEPFQFDEPFAYGGNLPAIKKVNGSIGVISFGYSGQNYYHFLLECMPMLGALEEAAGGCDYLYAPGRRPYHRQMFNLFGIESERLLIESNYHHYQADQLLVPSHIGQPSATFAKFLFKRVANRPWSKLGETKKKRIYISRSLTKRRNCKNENELMVMLKRYGFQRYHLEKMSLRDQVELFQQAELIVGPHGAGLVNMVFAPAGANVVELGTMNRPYGCFHHLANCCDHTFHWFVGAAIDAKGAESNIVVDVSQFEQYLRNEVLQRLPSAGQVAPSLHQVA